MIVYLFISDIFKEGSRVQWTSTALHKGPLYNNINKIPNETILGYKIQILQFTVKKYITNRHKNRIIIKMYRTKLNSTKGIHQYTNHKNYDSMLTWNNKQI